MDSNWWLVGWTAVLVVVTGVYAGLVAQQVDLQRKALEVQREALNDQMKPILIWGGLLEFTDFSVCMIRNVGRSPAFLERITFGEDCSEVRLVSKVLEPQGSGTAVAIKNWGHPSQDGRTRVKETGPASTLTIVYRDNQGLRETRSFDILIEGRWSREAQGRERGDLAPGGR
jgi:hypothetical protein